MSRTGVRWTIDLALLTGLLIVLAANPTSTPGGEWLDVQWDGEPACVDAVGAAAEATAIVGPSTKTSARLSVTQQSDDAFRVELELRSGRGNALRRTLRSANCATLTRAVALIIAVQADPVAAATTLGGAGADATPPPIQRPDPVPVVHAPPEPELEPEPEPQPEPEPEPQPSVDTRAGDRGGSAPTTPRPTPRLSLGAAIGAEIGVMPATSGLAEVSVGARWPHLRLSAVGLVSLPSVLELDDAVSVRFGKAGAAARACGVLARQRFEFAVCGALEAGGLTARAFGVADARSIRTLWFAGVVGLRPHFALGRRVALGVMADIAVPAIRHLFTLDDGQVIHLNARVAARLGATFRVRLP